MTLSRTDKTAETPITRRILTAALVTVSLGVAGLTVVIRPDTAALPDVVKFGAVFLGFLVSRLLAVRLPQGDEVPVPVFVGLYALGVLGLPWALVALLGAGLIEMAVRSRGSSPVEVLAIGREVLREVIVLSSTAPWQLLLWAQLQRTGTSESLLVLTLLAGIQYAAADLWSLALTRAISGSSQTRLAASFARPLISIYTVHVAMAAVALRVLPVLGARAFVIALLLTAVLQNSFNLYLRIRRAYTETIGALARAAELDRPQDAGHAQRVSELAVAVGRHLRLDSNELERLSYAALLHDIGKIGETADTASVSHAARGADIVADIPFLREVAPLIRDHHSAHAPLPAAIVGVCSEYDRVRRTHSASQTLEVLRAGAAGQRRAVVDALEELLALRSQRTGEQPW